MANVQTDAREELLAQRAQMGGVDPPITFSKQQQAILNAAADEVIPPGGGFPAPSAVDVVEFITRYVAPNGQTPRHFPCAEEGAFKAGVDRLGNAFVQAGSQRRIEILERASKEDATFFTQLRDLVYYGYYSRPAVTQAIRDNLEAGRDYHGPPQPLGYLSVTERWNESEIPKGRGSYTKTKEIKRIPVEKL